MLWDEDPSEWAPQNHSCDANTGLDGLNVVALRKISRNEELTLDYSQFLDENMEPFECKCGAPNCKGLIRGVLNNSVNTRECKALSFKGKIKNSPIAYNKHPRTKMWGCLF